MVQARARLLQALGQAALIPFVGAGLSAAVTDGKPWATWHGLLLSGLELCQREIAGLPDDWAANKKKELESADMVSYLTVAEDISLRLRGFHEGREFDSWIGNTVGSLEPTEEGRRIIESVCTLGNVVVTTNYDNLIEQVKSAWKSYTWTDKEFASAFTGSEVVLHLHGAAREPGSIILCSGDYQRLSANKLNQILSESLFVSRRFIFIGCGEGLADPHIAPLLKMMIDVIRESTLEHFILVTNDQYNQLRGDELSPRISAVPYGARYEDLPKFLEKLATGDKARVSQGPPSDAPGLATKPPSSWLEKAAQAQQKLQDTLELFDTAEDAMRQVGRRRTLPMGIDDWDYPYQQDKHEKLATSLSVPAKQLEDCSAQIVLVFEDAVDEVWQLMAPTFDMGTARLVPITERVSELVDVSRRLQARLIPAVDDLKGRTVCASYQVPCKSLSRARDSVEKAHKIAVSLQEGLGRQQARQEASETGASQSVVQMPGSAPPRTAAHLAEPYGPGLAPAEVTGSSDSEVLLIPVVGEVAAGTPVLADEQNREYLPLPARFVRREDAFAAKVRGDSMTGDGVHEGDYVVFVPDPEPKDGEMVVVLTEDIEGVEEVGVRVKRLWYEEDTTIRLESSGEGEPPVLLERDALRATYKVIAVVRWTIK
jgi:SOS-response transcriptional repressor LexA